MMEDTLRTAVGGGTVSVITWVNWLPQTVSVLVGCMTMVYLGIKIYKELKGTC